MRLGAEHARAAIGADGTATVALVASAADLALAVDCAIQGGFGSTGQRCTASSILMPLILSRARSRISRGR